MDVPARRVEKRRRAIKARGVSECPACGCMITPGNGITKVPAGWIHFACYFDMVNLYVPRKLRDSA